MASMYTEEIPLALRVEAISGDTSWYMVFKAADKLTLKPK